MGPACFDLAGRYFLALTGDANAADGRGRTPLQYAEHYRRSEVLELFVLPTLATDYRTGPVKAGSTVCKTAFLSRRVWQSISSHLQSSSIGLFSRLPCARVVALQSKDMQQ